MVGNDVEEDLVIRQSGGEDVPGDGYDGEPERDGL